VDCSSHVAQPRGVRQWDCYQRSPSSRPPHWGPQPRSKDAGSPCIEALADTIAAEPSARLRKPFEYRPP